MRFFDKFNRLALLAIAFCANHCFSQDFEVGPAKMNFDCEPGQIQNKTLYIRNHSNQKQKFNVTVADLHPDSAGVKKNNPLQYSCKDWITISPSFFDLNPNESKEITVSLQAPPNHSETRWCIIHVSTTEEQTTLTADQQMKSGVKVRPRIGIKVIQSPKSNSNYKGGIFNLKEITTAKDSTRAFEAFITNTGDKEITGKIFLVFSNLETAKEIKEKPIHANLLPGSTKKIVLYMPKTIPPGKYSMAAILDYGNNAPLEASQIDIEVK